MKDFLTTHDKKIKGVLNCFDRMLFRGYLPLMSGAEMAKFLNRNDVRFASVKSFLVNNASRVKSHAMAMAGKAGRPYEHLQRKIPMERTARQMAEADGITQGLVCVFSILEACRSFSFTFSKGTPFAKPARRKCLHLYDDFIDPEYGLIHVRVQTWFPMVIQVYLNGHDWLARKLDRHDIRYCQVDNTFVAIDDFDRAQAFADRFASLDWHQRLETYAHLVNPLKQELLSD